MSMNSKAISLSYPISRTRCYSHIKSTLRGLILKGLAIWLLIQPFGKSALLAADLLIFVQSRGTHSSLQINKPLERKLVGGQKHEYQLTLLIGQYLKLSVDQRGIDVALRLIDPNGKKLLEVDTVNGLQGTELIHIIAEISGIYRLEVYPSNEKAAAGSYEVKIVELRKAADSDMKRVLAEGAVREATELRKKGTEESREKAISKYNEALPVWRSLGDRKHEAETLRGLGDVYTDLSQPQKALDYLNMALSISRAIDDESEEAIALIQIGLAYLSLGDYQKASDYFSQALPIGRKIGNHQLEAVVLMSLGQVYYRMGDYEKSLNFLERALSIHSDVGDRQLDASIFAFTGTIYYSKGDTQKSFSYFSQALLIYRQMSNRSGETAMLRYIGRAYLSSGDIQKAINYFNQALPISREINDRSAELATIRLLGNAYSDIGEYSKSLDCYQQALGISKLLGDKYSEASTLTNIGLIYSDLDDSMKALDSLNLALTIWRSISNRAGEARVLNDIGSVYYRLGNKQASLDYYLQALVLWRSVGSRAGEADALRDIGSAYADLGEKEKALEFHRQALTLLRDFKNRAGEGRELASIGSIYNELGDYGKALDYFNQALPINREVGDRTSESITLSNIGMIYNSLGEKQRSREYSLQALSITRAIGDRDGEASLLYNLASIDSDEGKLSESRSRIESAIEIIESLRDKTNRPDLRVSHSAAAQDYYGLYIDVLMRLYRDHPSEGLNVTALLASDRARAHSLIDALRLIRSDIREGADPVLLERERTLRQLLNAKAESQFRLLSGPHSDQQAAASEKELSGLLMEMQVVEAQIRKTSPRYATLKEPQALSLQAIQGLLDKDTVLLEYSLGEHQSYLWAITSVAMKSYELPKKAVIESAAQRVYGLLVARARPQAGEVAANTRDRVREADTEYERAASSLSQMILGSLSSELTKKRLLLVTEGILRYIPFAALPDPSIASNDKRRKQPLIIEHEIVHLPSANTIVAVRSESATRRPAAKTIAVLADPVFDISDPRVNRKQGALINSSVPAISSIPVSPKPQVQQLVRQLEASGNETRPYRLPFSEKEARGILSFVSEKEAKLALGFDANRETATSPELREYRILHFATHTYINNRYPALSGIILSLVDKQGDHQDGFLLTQEVYNLRLPVELVVLSSCQSAFGEEVKGEGLVSLTRGFMYAGAARLVASLWAVDDEATSQLMIAFYRGLLKEGLRPPAALRAAQIEILKQQKWQSPYYWAAFVLQGEWQ